MGVRGLTTFVNQNRQFFDDYNLNSTKLVVDGYGLMSKFYFDHSIDPGNHGGEFQKFYNHCANFFRNMSHCGVECYVIFDGGYDLDGKKFETLKERLQQKISSVTTVTNGKHACIMPTMASEVFKKVMRDLGVPFVFSDFEADRDIAVLANSLHCPVLGQDSDFFIMNIQYGYIPLDRLEWRHPASLSQKQKRGQSSPVPKKIKVLRCQRYKINKFCNYFQVDPCLMPLFASLSGNDYLQAISLNGFYGATKHQYQKKSDRKPHPRHKGHFKFCDLLHHLTFYTSLLECLEEVMKHVHSLERTNVRTALKASCDMYEVSSPSPVVAHFQKDRTDVFGSNLSTDHGIPGPFLEMLHLGEVPTMCLNIYLNRTYFMGTQVEKLSEARSSLCSDYLQRILAGIMLVDIAEEFKAKGSTLTIDIYDRDKLHVKCYQVEPLCDVPNFGKVLSFKRMPMTSGHQRRSLLLAALNAKNVKVDSLPLDFQLVLLVTIYWSSHAQLPISHNLVCALVLGWVQGVAWCKRNAQHLPHKHGAAGCESISNWDEGEVTVVLKNFKALMERSLRKHLDLDVCHGLAQWVSCVRIADYLNAVLLQVYPRADMTVLFNGLLLHNLIYQLNGIHPNAHREWIGNTLLLHAPHAHLLFNDLMTFLTSHINFQVPSQPRAHPSQQPRGQYRGRGRNRHRGGRGGNRHRGGRGKASGGKM